MAPSACDRPTKVRTLLILFVAPKGASLKAHPSRGPVWSSSEGPSGTFHMRTPAHVGARLTRFVAP
eukprot:598526-Pyramimonas_sp.AAC.1